MFEQFADHDFGTLFAQRFTALIFAVHERPHGVTILQKMTNGMSTRFTRCACNEVFALLHDELSNLTV
jgi:hypothetical protein